MFNQEIMVNFVNITNMKELMTSTKDSYCFKVAPKSFYKSDNSNWHGFQKEL